MAELCSNFGDSAITKGQIAYFLLRMRETAIFLLPSKIGHHHRVPRPRFPMRRENFGDIREHLRQTLLAYLHEFSGPLGQKWRFLWVK